MGRTPRTLLVLMCLPVLLGCLWDSDTLAMERRQFPTALELITGKFLRHSEGFYRWRANDRRAKLKQQPGDPRLLDDLAVAYDKLGEHEKAIELLQPTQGLNAQRYETQANLGTFYIHAGKLEKGARHIELALEINPDAHFGRERYQKWLVEYVLQQRAAGRELPLSASTQPPHTTRGFALYLEKAAAAPKFADGVKGVLGMMRFGNHRSPVLLEALGDLLVASEGNSRLLASRAYLRASQLTQGDTSQAYRQLAREALDTQTGGLSDRQVKLSELEADLAKEVAEGDAWFAAVRADEEKWIRDGVDVEAAFSAKYYEAPKITTEAATGAAQLGLVERLVLILGVFVLFVTAVAAGLFFWLRKKRPLTPPAS